MKIFRSNAWHAHYCQELGKDFHRLPEKKKRKTKLAFLVRGLKISKNGSFAQVEGLLKKTKHLSNRCTKTEFETKAP